MKTTIRNVEIKSVAAWLPANKISLLSFCGSFPEKQVRDVIRSSGAEYVYRAEEGQKASDLCFNAAEHLLFLLPVNGLFLIRQYYCSTG